MTQKWPVNADLDVIEWEFCSRRNALMPKQVTHFIVIAAGDCSRLAFDRRPIVVPVYTGKRKPGETVFVNFYRW